MQPSTAACESLTGGESQITNLTINNGGSRFKSAWNLTKRGSTAASVTVQNFSPTKS